MKLYVGKAVHCNTREKSNEFLNNAAKLGWVWFDTIEHGLGVYMYGCDTVYEVNADKTITITSINNYKNKDRMDEVIEYELENEKETNYE